MKMKTRNLFALAAVTACVGMAFVGVASASAFTFFNAETAPVKIKGTQTETANFTTNAGAISCTNGTFEGENTVTQSETQSVSLAYSGCTFLNTLNVPVTPNGCQYKFHASGTADVVCPEGKFIEFSAVSCTVKIGSQTGLGTITFENVGSGSGRTVNVLPNVTGIKYTQSALCPGGAGTFTNGTYKNGKANVVGKTSKGAADGVFVS